MDLISFSDWGLLGLAKILIIICIRQGVIDSLALNDLQTLVWFVVGNYFGVEDVLMPLRVEWYRAFTTTDKT